MTIFASIMFCIMSGIIMANIAELLVMCCQRQALSPITGLFWAITWAVFTGLVLGMVGKWPIF